MKLSDVIDRRRMIHAVQGHSYEVLGTVAAYPAMRAWREETQKGTRLWTNSKNATGGAKRDASGHGFVIVRGQGEHFSGWTRRQGGDGRPESRGRPPTRRKST